VKVICIHVFGKENKAGVKITVEIGGIYDVIGRGTFPDGNPYYEFAHQPGVGYYTNCFVPLDPWNDPENYFINQNDKTMTTKQRGIVIRLCSGFYLRKIGDRYKLYEGKENPVMWISPATLRGRIIPILRWTHKDGRGTIDRKAVMNLHGNDWIKRYYKHKKYGAKFK